MKMLLIDVVKNKVEVVDCDGKLQTLYNLLNCDFVEIVDRNINGVRVHIICDEEGKLHGVPKISGIMYDNSDYFVGNLLVCGLVNSDGELTGLSEKEIELINENIIDVSMNDFDFPEIRKVLVNIKY